MGNTSRFINHADQDKENLYSQCLLTEGRFKIAFFARKDLEPDDELFFDYDGEGQLYENYKEKYPFINKKKNKKT
jgi:SET domain-containing protein